MKNKIIFYIAVSLFIITLQLFILSAVAQVDVVQNNVPVSISNGITVTVNGNITYNTTASVSNNGTLKLNGNWINNTTGNVFGNAGGIVDFAGTNQFINGANPTFFNTLIVNASALTLNQDISTGLNNGLPSGGNLILNTGLFNLNSHLATVENGNTNGISRISGMMVSETDGLAGYGQLKWKLSGNTGIYQVPFGNPVSNTLLPFVMQVSVAGVPSSAGQGSFTVNTYPTLTSASPNNRSLPTGVTHLNNALNLDNASKTLDRFWVLDVQGYSTNPVSTMTMTYRDSEHDASNGSTNTITESLLKAQRWDGTQWTVQQGVVNISSNTVSVTGINTFNGAWALAGSNAPLPIELMSFNARLNASKKVDLTWLTASEINNDFFSMERSSNGVDFESIGIVDGAGNSHSTMFYSGIDAQPYRGVSYYRLKQTDFDGSYTYSEIRTINIEQINAASSAFAVYPNPSTDQAFIQLQGSEIDENSTLEIFDALGKLVFKNTLFDLNAGKKDLYQINVNTFRSGFYMIRIRNGETLLGAQKMIVK